MRYNKSKFRIFALLMPLLAIILNKKITKPKLYMKRILFALMLGLFTYSLASAQMSDEEIIEFVQEQHDADA